MSKLETHASDHPKRYCRGDIECKDAIRAALTPEQYEGWLRGTLMKYIWRYDALYIVTGKQIGRAHV